MERSTEARRLRAVVEEVLEGVFFEVEAGVRYIVTDKTVRGGGGGEAEGGGVGVTAESPCAAADGCLEDRIIPKIETTARQ